MTLSEEIEFHQQQFFREIGLAQLADTEFAQKAHLTIARHHSEIVEQLRAQLVSDDWDEQASEALP
jgi:uncharacterized protein YaeQ